MPPIATPPNGPSPVIIGAVLLGGMFSILKVRKDQKRGDYKDPGWFTHPKGTVAQEWTGSLSEPKRSQLSGGKSMPLQKKNQAEVEVQVRKPMGKMEH